MKMTFNFNYGLVRIDRVTTRAYGVLWRWHFLAGLAACPILAIVALTGALYCFQPELDRWANRELVEVEPAGTRRPLDELLATATSRACTPSGVYAPGDPRRAMVVYCTEGARREVFIDPYRGAVVGAREVGGSFFGVVFALHWELLLGDVGRYAIEWATSWCVLLAASGLVLWWPRGKRRGGGVWWPRRRLRDRQWLRDLHAVAGAYTLPVLIALAATGLMWTALAGDRRWRPLTEDAAQQVFDHPPVSTAASSPRVGYAAALAAAGIDLASERRAIYFSPIGAEPDAAYSFYVYDDSYEAPSLAEGVWIDAYRGAVLRRVTWSDRSAIGKLDGARYAIHVGALLALPGRIAACAAALVLAALCITGPWMWWKRRPRGKLGLPPRTRRVAWPALAALAAIGWVLPMVGWTLVALAAIELVVWWRSTRAQLTAPPRP